MRIAKKSCIKGNTTEDGVEMAHIAFQQLELYCEDMEEFLRRVNGLES